MRTPMRTPLLAALLAFALPATAQEDCTRDAMVVFDGSGSMSEMGFNQLDLPRIMEARIAVRKAMPRIAPFRRLGLVVYGPGPEDVCANVDLRFPPTADAAGRIVAEVEALQPAGDTPLTEAVREAARVLDYRAKPGVIVLVTDGKETCGGAPCQLAVDLAEDGADLTVHVIGFRVRGDHFSWDREGGDYADSVSVASCLADRTGGQYVSTETVGDLVAALQQTLGCAVIGQAGAAAPARRG